MKRPPTIVWLLAPLVLGLLYYLAYGLFAPSPTLENVVPGNAILTHRFRDRDALDKGWLPQLEIWLGGPPNPSTRPSERMARDRNLAALPGVDIQRPFHLVFLPRHQQPDPTLMILPVVNADALCGRFEDPSYFLEKGYVRHAQYLAIRGDFAAISGDRDAVHRLGEGGLTAEELGEDNVLAIRVPEVVRFALLTPWVVPWRDALIALGFDPAEARGTDPARPAGRLEVPIGRVRHVHDAWRTARLWSWITEGRIRADLAPAPGRLADLLVQLASRPQEAGGRTLPSAPRIAQAWILVPDAGARAALVWALFSAGVAFPEGLRGDDDPLGDLGRPDVGTGLLVFALPSPGSGHAWTLGVVGHPGALPDLRPFHEAFPPTAGHVEVPEGGLPITLADLQSDRVAPAAEIRRGVAGNLELVVFGAAAEEAWQRFQTHVAMDPSQRREPVEAPVAGLRLVATFGLKEPRARTLLGPALEKGGILRALTGGDIEGEVWTDGRVLRLEARVIQGERPR